ncbi:uncharacterized protein [Salminus brasiliensis]|uniref:uncharacterized protein n=1 Tax=Salminus brasiliensis TaxID=930266 RepID=UPI003B835711
MTLHWPGRCLLLLLCMAVLSQASEGYRRIKREWILPATKLTENVDYTKKEFIAKIWSDKHTEVSSVEYSLTGRGADMEPYNLFIVNPQNGLVRITGLLDREEISQYNLKGLARYKNGSLAEGDVHLKIQVLDQNDNPPKFILSKGSVKECSKIGTPVMQIRAEDADEPGTIHTKIAYSIVKQIPEGAGPMFSINRETGEIYVKQHTLDRETLDSYTLVVQGVDMGGAPNGNTGTGTVQIKVLDINDNVPTLEKEEYTGHIDEGAVNVVVMRIKALDKDLENTDNWLAHFIIIEGNEDGVFSIETDPKTNEGILKLVKPVDYEKVKELNLGLVILNVAPFTNGTTGTGGGGEYGGGGGGLGGGEGGGGGGGGGGTAAAAGSGAGAASSIDIGIGGKHGVISGGKQYSVKIFVNNLYDGLAFSPSVKVFPVTEDPEKNQVPKMIGFFPALDGDTEQIAENVRYAKAYDPDNWLSINEQTSEIKLVKTPDRESAFLVNGTYFAKIICMTQDVPPKTATGTIALKVQDANDHCPKLISPFESVCSDTKVINVTAFDEDGYPNGEPFTFVLIEEETHGEWEMVPVNGTTVSFHAKELLWPGIYELTVEIFDMQDLGCEDRQKLQVEVCTCEEGNTCVIAPRAAQQHVSSVKVGVPAIGLLLTGLALLMLVPLFLLFCQCGTVNKFMELPFDAKEHLILYHTEGKGEDMEVPLSVPDRQPMAVADKAGSNFSMMLSQVHGPFLEIDTMSEYQNNAFSFEHHKSNPYVSSFRHEVQDIYGGIALPDDYLNDYFTQKAKHEAANPPLMDSLLVYSYEGQDSPVGSLDCCTLLESGNNLAFLNDLGPKFMTLAEICSPSKLCLPSPDVESSANALDTSIKTESSVTTNIVEDSQPSFFPPEQSNIDTITLSNSDSISTINTSQIQLVEQQQPLYYLVERQVPTTVILAKRPTCGTYLINGSAETGGLILQDTTNPSSPESPTLPTVWFQGNQSCFQHHELPGSQKLVLVQSEGNVVPAVLPGIDSGYPIGNLEFGNVVLVQDTMDPGRSTQAQAEFQLQDSTLKFSQACLLDRGNNVSMLRHDTASLSQPKEALAQLNMKDDRPQFRLAPSPDEEQENMEEFSNQVSTDDTDGEGQNTFPSVINVMPPISPHILLARPTTADVLAKANAIQKELEQTLLAEGFNNSVSFARQESAANSISGNDDFSDTKTVDLVSTIQTDALDSECETEEPNLTVREASVLPHDTDLNGATQARLSALDCPKRSVVSTETLIEVGDGVFTHQLERKTELVAFQSETEGFQATLLTEEVEEDLQQQNLEDVKKNEHGLKDVNESASPLEEASVTVPERQLGGTNEANLEQSLRILDPEEETKAATSDSEKDDFGNEPQSGTEMPDDTQAVDQEETVAEQLNAESDQEPDQALDVHFAPAQDISCMTLEVDAEVGEATEFQEENKHPKSEEQHIEEVKTNGDGPNQIQMTEETPVTEQEEIAEVEINAESDLQHCQLLASADHQSNAEVDVEEVISGTPVTHLSIDPGVRDIQHYIETSEVKTVEEVQMQASVGQINPQGIKQCGTWNEALSLRGSTEFKHNLPTELMLQEDVDLLLHSSEDIAGRQLETDTDGDAVVEFQVDVLSDKEKNALHPKQKHEASVLTSQRQDYEKLLEPGKHQTEQDVHDSSAQADFQMTGNTVQSIKSIRADYSEGAYLENEVTCGTASQECASVSIQTDPSPSTFGNLNSVQDGVKYEDKEVQQTLSQVNEEPTGLPLGLSEEGTPTPEEAILKISEDLTQEQEVQGEKTVNMSSEVMEQVLTTATSMSASGATDLQAESEQEAMEIPKNKHRNSKKSSKKVTSPRSPVGKCKSQ